MTAEQTAFLLFNNVVKLHGEPETLISDRQSVFAGRFLPHYARLLGTQTRLSTAYHPQTDGQTERMNRILEDMLRTFVTPLGDNWDELLPACVGLFFVLHQLCSFVSWLVVRGRAT